MSRTRNSQAGRDRSKGNWRRALITADWPETLTCINRRHWLAVGLVAVMSVAGCGKEEKRVAASVSEPPVMEVIHPQLRDIVRFVGQPSFVQSFERTSIYPKMTAFIEKWNVDIGDKVPRATCSLISSYPNCRRTSARRRRWSSMTPRKFEWLRSRSKSPPRR